MPTIKPIHAVAVVGFFIAVVGAFAWLSDPSHGFSHYSPAPAAAPTLSSQLNIAITGPGKTVPGLPVAFDVPALINSNIDGVRNKLGAPSQYSDPATTPHQPEEQEWDETWTVGKWDLLVTYNLGSGKIIDYFVGTDDPSGACSDFDRIRTATNVAGEPKGYSLEGVGAGGHPGEFTGLKIIPH